MTPYVFPIAGKTGLPLEEVEKLRKNSKNQ